MFPLLVRYTGVYDVQMWNMYVYLFISRKILLDKQLLDAHIFE